MPEMTFGISQWISHFSIAVQQGTKIQVAHYKQDKVNMLATLRADSFPRKMFYVEHFGISPLFHAAKSTPGAPQNSAFSEKVKTGTVTAEAISLNGKEMDNPTSGQRIEEFSRG